MCTALCYLNDVEEGGGTQFTRLNITVKAKKGRMLVFQNTYNGTNNKHLMSEHAGMPVLKGEKYAFNLWFRECPRYVLYKDFNPKYYEDGESILKEKIRLQVESIQRKEENYSKIIQKYNLHNKLSDQLTEVTKNVYVKENALSDSLVEKHTKNAILKI